MASAAKLYTPEVLALATGLAAFPWDESLPISGEARSKSCGSTLALAVSLDEHDRIDRVAVRAQACAVGQAAARIFAEGAIGRKAGEIVEADDAIARWLADGGPLPTWPGLSAIAAARDYPARHGAIRLAWKAACDMLS